MRKIFDLHEIDALIFDMDGTMINNMPYHRKAWIAFCQKYGMELSEDEFNKKFSGKKNNELMKMVFGEKITEQQIKDYGNEKEALYRELYKKDIIEVKGLTYFVSQLQKTEKKLAIATTASKENREFCLEALHLQNIFDPIIGEENVTYGKPNPEIYLLTSKKLGVSPERCVVFEDSPVGVSAAKAAGMYVIGILTGYTAQELTTADCTIETYEELKIYDNALFYER